MAYVLRAVETVEAEMHEKKLQIRFLYTNFEDLGNQDTSTTVHF